MKSQNPFQPPTRTRSRYLTSVLRIAPALLILLIGALTLTGCVGFTPFSLTPPPPSPAPETAVSGSTAPPVRVTLTAQPEPIVPTPTSAITVSSTALNGVEIRFWRARSDFLPGNEGPDSFQGLVDDFNRQNPYGIHVQSLIFPDTQAVVTQLTERFSIGKPALLMLHPYQAAHLLEEGSDLVDLTPYIQDPRWGFSPAQASSFYPAFWHEEQLDGRQVGLPFARTADVLFYNITWARELGLSGPPATPEDFQRQMCLSNAAFRQDSDPSNDGYGGWYASTRPATFLAWLSAFDSQIVNAAGYTFDTPETNAAVTFLRELYTGNCAFTSQQMDARQAFATRHALAVSGGLSGIAEQQQALDAAENRDLWTVWPYPSLSGDPAIDAYGQSLYLPRSTPQEELAAWVFMQWLVSPEVQAEWVEATGGFPVTQAALPALSAYQNSNPQWSASLEFVSYVHPEPARPSWAAVRWVVADAAGMLFSPVFRDVPNLLTMLQETADEMDQMEPESQPTLTPTPQPESPAEPSPTGVTPSPTP